MDSRTWDNRGQGAAAPYASEGGAQALSHHGALGHEAMTVNMPIGMYMALLRPDARAKRNRVDRCLGIDQGEIGGGT